MNRGRIIKYNIYWKYIKTNNIYIKLKKLFFVASKDIIIFQNLLSFPNEENVKLKIENIFSKEANKKEIKINKNFVILKIKSEYENLYVIMHLFKYI